MANFDKWAQPTAGHRGSNGPSAGGRTGTNWKLPEQKLVSPFGATSPFGAVQAAQQAVAPADSGQALGDSFQQALNQKLQAQMGPYVNVANPPTTSAGAWSGGPLGQVPNHHGWAGLKENTKQWALRLMGAFPGLRFSSGFRSPSQNAAAGGHPNSGHMRGDKVDFSGDRRLLAAAAEWARRHGGRVLLHDAGSGYHLDISWAGVRA